MWNKKLLFVISGPSGSGKTTLIKALLEDKQIRGKIQRSISYTSRPRRKGERDKKDYIFISEEDFKKKLRAKKILEWTHFLNYYYGTPLDYFKRLLKQNKHIIFCLDEKGAFKIKKLYPKNTVMIFILPPNMVALKRRIYKREGSLDRKQLLERLNLARNQLKQAKFYDYQLINQDFDQTLKELKQIILREITSN